MFQNRKNYEVINLIIKVIQRISSFSLYFSSLIAFFIIS